MTISFGTLKFCICENFRIFGQVVVTATRERVRNGGRYFSFHTFPSASA